MCIRTLSENHSSVIRAITWKLSKMIISVEKTHKTVWVEELLVLMLLVKMWMHLSADINYGWLFPCRLTDNFHSLSLVTELKSHHNEWATRSKSICISGGTRLPQDFHTMADLTVDIKLLTVDILCNCTSVSLSTTAL